MKHGNNCEAAVRDRANPRRKLVQRTRRRAGSLCLWHCTLSGAGTPALIGIDATRGMDGPMERHGLSLGDGADARQKLPPRLVSYPSSWPRSDLFVEASAFELQVLKDRAQPRKSRLQQMKNLAHHLSERCSCRSCKPIRD